MRVSVHPIPLRIFEFDFDSLDPLIRCPSRPSLRIERNSQVRFNPQADLLLLQKIPEAYALAKVLSEWEDLVFSSSSAVFTTLDPSPLVLYLFNLAAEVGQANRTMRVKGMKPEVAEARWLLFWCAKKVLEEGLWLLGLESVGTM